MTEPLFEATANCLYPDVSVRLDGVPNRFLARQVDASVKRHGNWVGGRVSCFDDRLVFAMNALNAKFQEDSADVVVPYDDIDGAGFGRMMKIFRTVDFETAYGPLRFRCGGKASERLLETVRRRIG